jgi:ABC-type protease/lipase transport system fused ATPase/permease subunit
MNIQQIAQSNIFFFVTTIAIIIISILIAIALIQLIRILRTVKEVSDTFKTEGKNIVQDISSLRSSLKEKGANISSLVTLAGIASFIKKKAVKKKKTSI